MSGSTVHIKINGICYIVIVYGNEIFPYCTKLQPPTNGCFKYSSILVVTDNKCTEWGKQNYRQHQQMIGLHINILKRKIRLLQTFRIPRQSIFEQQFDH